MNVLETWCPARPGMNVAEVDTPALLVDLDAFERNLAHLMRAVPPGVRVRPHAKTHKSAAIARLQIAAGAVGVCVQKVGEAEALLRGGVTDILISNEIIGVQKCARLAALARAYPAARLGICVDAALQVAQLAEAFAEAAVSIDVLVEINAGGRRCGVETPEQALALARLIGTSPGLRFAGLQAYHGAAQHLRTPAERQAAISDAIGRTRAVRDLLALHGFACHTIGGAGSGTFELEGASGVYNELQPGSYLFMDADYGRNASSPEVRAEAFEHSLFILASVMSTSAAHAVLDAGHKAHSADSGMPLVAGRPELRYHRPSDEHGVIVGDAGAALPALGEKLLLIPGHRDPTVNLYDHLVGVRGGLQKGVVEVIWRIDARGATY